jgi:AmiR/NasT family two-component response regulator
MRQAMHDRDTISVAKGVLMGRDGLDEDSALRLLLARSERDGSTVAAAARSVVEAVVRRRR